MYVHMYVMYVCLMYVCHLFFSSQTLGGCMSMKAEEFRIYISDLHPTP